MSSSNPRVNSPFLAGAITVTFAGFLAASVEGLAYVTHWIRFYPITLQYGPVSSYVAYYPLNFGVHSATLILAVCVAGGFLGLLYSVKPKLTSLAFVSLLLTAVGLLFQPELTLITIPEVNYFEVPWIGSYIVLVGFSLMLVGLANIAKKSWARRMAILLVPVLLALYAVYPVFVVTNSLPYAFFGSTYISLYPIVYSCISVCFLALLILLALSYKNNLLTWIRDKSKIKENV